MAYLDHRHSRLREECTYTREIVTLLRHMQACVCVCVCVRVCMCVCLCVCVCGWVVTLLRPMQASVKASQRLAKAQNDLEHERKQLDFVRVCE